MNTSGFGNLSLANMRNWNKNTTQIQFEAMI
jgi:hypothetical protein